MNESPTLSAVIPITERYDDVEAVFLEYKAGLAATGLKFEIVYVLDGQYPRVLETLKTLQNKGEKITIATLARRFGEATALNVGFDHTCGDIILTLPAYRQIKGSEIPRLVESLGEADLVIGRRFPRSDSRLNRLQANMFSFLVRRMSGLSLHDAACGVRAFKRQVLEEVYVYGDLHRFLPLLAYRQGFRVSEVPLAQSEHDLFRRIYAPGVYVRRLLDVLTIYFLFKFTKKPLRFFGLIGLGTLTVGLTLVFYQVVERLFFDVALANRPALLLSSLLIVLGIQILAIGLIGEIVIFSHAKDLKEYTVDKIVN